MKEATHTTKHPWIAGLAVAAIAVTYFVLLGTSRYPEPGPNLNYDIQTYADLDNIETDFEELGEIAPDLESPRAMAVSAGKLYVAGKDAVVVFGDGDEEIARHVIEGTPNCLGVAPDGTIYVGLPTQVMKLAADGSDAAEWGTFSERSYLTSIAILKDDVYVADAGKRVVYRYNSAGELQAEIGKVDPERDVPGLEVPSPYLDLAVNDDGELWVVNPGKLGLERFRADGEFVTSWYRPSLRLEGFSGCCNPTQIAFQSDGTLITSEKGLVRVKSYEVTSGEFKELIAGSKLFPREQSVRDLVVDAQDRILILDPRSDSIRVFARKEAQHDSAHQPA